jgi:sugar phosphate isomerase/epimerase
MITTSVTSAEDPTAEGIFAAAAESGIRHLKLGYWRYAGFGQLREQMARIQRDLDGIEKLAGRFGVWAGIHNHSGDVVSALPAVVDELIRDRDPAAVGSYFDPGHATAEGGISGWKLGLDLLAPRIRLVAVKSFGWFREGAGESVEWRAKLVPLAEGTVRWREVFDLLQRTGFEGIVSVHSEYQGSHSWRDLSTEELIEQTRADLGYLRACLDR